MDSFITVMALVAVFLAWPSKYMPKGSMFYENSRDDDKIPVDQCPHAGDKTLVTVQSAATCETLQCICDDCGHVIAVHTEC